MSTLNSNMAASNRHSRLVQPASRLSFVSSTSKTTANTSSTFQPASQSESCPASPPANNNNAGHRGPLGQRMDHYPHAAIYADQLPNANTSGLPAPRQLAYGFCEAGASHPIPSTVGSALRRFQGSPITVSGIKPGSRLPSPSLSLTQTSSSQSASFCVRRSQSQKPLGQQLGGYRQSSFAAHLRTTARPKSQSRHESNDRDDADEDNRCVESLPPLKSTNYISRLISSGSEPSSASDSVSNEPGAASSSYIKSPSSSAEQAAPTASKPSQLVKPLPSRCIGSKLTAPNSETVKYGGNSLALAYSSNRALANRASSFGRTKTSLPAQSGLVMASNKSAIGSKTVFPAANGRRLSLQNTHFKPNAARPVVDEADRSDAESSGEGADEDTEEEPGDEDGDEATAATMTQMSETNVMLTNANQELNTMIQMLSSSAILGESDANGSTSDPFGGYRSQPAKQSDGSRRISIGSTGSQLPKIKGQIVKSQSLSFKARDEQPLESPVSSRVSAKPTYGNRNQSSSQSQLIHPFPAKSAFAGPVGTVTHASSTGVGMTQRSQLGGIKLPRPRSRIIFDPTSSQFHVSCTQETIDSQQYGSNGQSSEDSSIDTNEDLINQSLAVCREDQDEASIKLLDTQNRIITLKYLPSAEPEPEDNKEPEREGDTISRLKDCRGSLESLMAGQRDSVGSEPRNAPFHGSSLSTPNRPEPPKNRRSPVGSALRSLFGFQSLSGHTSGKAEAGRSKVATIVRHGSLRSDPRPSLQQEAQFADRKISLQDGCPLLDTKQSRNNLGSDLLQRASKKLSASSSSLTSKFKFIASSTSSSTSLSSSNSKPPEPSGSTPDQPGSIGTKSKLSTLSKPTPDGAVQLGLQLAQCMPLIRRDEAAQDTDRSLPDAFARS